MTRYQEFIKDLVEDHAKGRTKIFPMSKAVLLRFLNIVGGETRMVSLDNAEVRVNQRLGEREISGMSFQEACLMVTHIGNDHTRMSGMHLLTELHKKDLELERQGIRDKVSNMLSLLRKAVG